jgi:hypothetical protein
VIATDSSVWIDFFRGRVTRETTVLRSLIEQGVVLMGDLVLAVGEVLQGFLAEKHAEAGPRSQNGISTRRGAQPQSSRRP